MVNHCKLCVNRCSKQINHSETSAKQHFFPQELCVIQKISIRLSEKKHKTIEKVDMSTMPTFLIIDINT